MLGLHLLPSCCCLVCNSAPILTLLTGCDHCHSKQSALTLAAPAFTLFLLFLPSLPRFTGIIFFLLARSPFTLPLVHGFIFNFKFFILCWDIAD